MTALDFSSARPGSAALNAAGVTSVGRYLAADGRGITPAEFDDYIGHGISVWFIKENAARGMLNGYGQGVADAQWAENQMNALGVSGAPIYFTVDFDAQSWQFAALDAYLNGAASIIGASRIGVYAGLHYLNHLYLTTGLCSYYWKTASSSFDHGEPAAMQLHLIQTLDAVPISGTDYNIIGRPYHGQVNSTGPAGITTIPITSQQGRVTMIVYNTGTGFYLSENGHSVEFNDALINGQQITAALSAETLRRVIYDNPEGKLTLNVEEASIVQYWIGKLN